MMIMTDLQAAGIESLIMTGELIEGHAKYDDECTSCHRLFSNESQNRLCLDCHDAPEAVGAGSRIRRRVA